MSPSFPRPRAWLFEEKKMNRTKRDPVVPVVLTLMLMAESELVIPRKQLVKRSRMGHGLGWPKGPEIGGSPGAA